MVRGRGGEFVFVATTTPRARRDEAMAASIVIVEARTAVDASVLNSSPNMKARMSSMAAGARGSVGWLSCFDSHCLHASRHDFTSLARILLLSDDLITVPCDCGLRDTGDGQFVEHVLTCSKVRGANRTVRHNLVVSALAHNLRRFGCLIHLEPRFYTYSDGSKKRPDISVLGSPGVCTDVVISIDPATTLQEKREKHGEAVQSFGHEFIPTALSIWGEQDKSIDSFLSKAFEHLSGRLHILAILQTKRSMSEAWLIGTSAMLTGIAHRAYASFDEVGLGAEAPF
jgi:hypothetical protein